MMKKRLQITKFQSARMHDGLAFVFTMVVDGEPRFIVESYGDGGSYLCSPLGPDYARNKALILDIEHWANAQPPVTVTLGTGNRQYELPYCIDILIDELIEEQILKEV